MPQDVLLNRLGIQYPVIQGPMEEAPRLLNWSPRSRIPATSVLWEPLT